MHRLMLTGMLAVLLASHAWTAEDVVTAVHGTVSKVDSDARIVVVKAADGTEHTLRLTARTTVHGTEAIARGTETAAKDTYRGLRAGSEVVAHYTTKDGEKSAEEVDKVGKDGIHAVEGTVTQLDRDGKKLAMKAADGTEHTFTLTDHAAVASAKDVDAAAVKTGKVTVYYTETAGEKIAHFFEKK
jgi:hypothetical protein